MVSNSSDSDRRTDAAQKSPQTQDQSLASRTRKRLEEELEGRQHEVESRIESMVHSMHDAVDLFHDEDEQMLARCMDYAAGRLESVAKYLKDRSFRGLRDDAAGLARDHSWMFLGAALVSGVLIGRFLRSSSRSLFDEEQEPHRPADDARSQTRAWEPAPSSRPMSNPAPGMQPVSSPMGTQTPLERDPQGASPPLPPSGPSGTYPPGERTMP